MTARRPRRGAGRRGAGPPDGEPRYTYTMGQNRQREGAIAIHVVLGRLRTSGLIHLPGACAGKRVNRELSAAWHFYQLHKFHLEDTSVDGSTTRDHSSA